MALLAFLHPCCAIAELYTRPGHLLPDIAIKAATAFKATSCLVVLQTREL